jgi:nitrite reductase (NO-forming)
MNTINNKKTSVARSMAIALSLVAIITIMAACGGSSDSGEEESKGSDVETIQASLTDDVTSMSIDPPEVTVKSGTEVVVEATNDGTVIHNLAVDEKNKTADLDQFASGTLEVGEVTEDTVLFCAIPGHREQGMEMTIKVEG